MYKLVNVSKSYGKGSNLVNVLNNVNISFPNVGLVSILGKSGSGKSTLLNLLTGLDIPTKGEIYFLNNNLNKFNNKDKKTYQNQTIGVLFQHFNLFDDLSCLENVMLPSLIKGNSSSDSKQYAISLFKQYGLEKLINQKFSTLSGGEKQRIALLRALINKPKIIIADEPTGALDSKNSVLIMKELKALSKDHLVIVVTHNEELIKDYEDYRINIINGSVSEIKFTNSIIIHQSVREKNSNKNFIFKFVKLHLAKHKVRNIITATSILFSSLCLLISFGYLTGSKISVNNYKKESLLYTYATVAKKTKIEIPDSPIIISKLTRPLKEDIEFLTSDINSLKVENNYQIVFPNLPTFNFDNKYISDIEFAPVYNFSLFKNLFVSGTIPTQNNFLEVVVNEEFVNHFSYSDKNIVNHFFNLDTASEMTNKTDIGKTIKDEIYFKNRLKIIGVVKEFAYLNSPRVYYSYLGLKNLLKNYVLLNYSKEIERNINVDEVISNADPEDANSSYSYNLFIDDINEVTKLFNFKKEYDQKGTFDITSSSYTISSSYQEMTEIISTSLIVFLIITLLGAIFIMIITAFSNFTQNKKESAILSIIGTDKISIFNIFNVENLIVNLLAVLSSFILSLPVTSLANLIIEKSFHLSNLLASPFSNLSPLILLISSIIIVIFSSLIPFLFYENGYIIEELKDE